MNKAKYIYLALVALIVGASIPISLYLWGAPLTVQSTVTTSSIPVTQGNYTGTQATAGYENTTVLSEYSEVINALTRAINYTKMQRSIAEKPVLYSVIPPAVTVTVTPTVTTALLATTEVKSVEAYTAPTGTRVSWTNVQVPGVDELDIVKTNGRVLAIASTNKVFIVGTQEKRILGEINTSGYVQGLFLQGDKLIVITHEVNATTRPLPLNLGVMVVMPREHTVVSLIDISDPGNPTVLKRVEVSGSLLSARLVRDAMYVVVSQPAIEGEQEVTLPVVNSRPLCARCIVYFGDLGEVYTNVLALNITSLEYTTVSILTRAGSRLYMSYERLYVASTRYPSTLDVIKHVVEAAKSVLPEEISSKLSSYLSKGDIASAYSYLLDYIKSADNPTEILEKIRDKALPLNLNTTTSVYVFNVNGLNVTYVGEVTVEGALLDQFAIEEYRGHLLLATTVDQYEVDIGYKMIMPPVKPPETCNVEVYTCTDNKCTTTTIPVKCESAVYSVNYIYLYPYLRTTGTDNRVYVVDLGTLRVKGVLSSLAPGERIYAARLVKDVFFLVTFRQVDPLFAIDVSDPENPRVLGYLKIPGFSEYLHPLPEDMLLGVGREERGDLKISLFNVSDPTKMNEVSKIVVKRAHSPALSDHHAVTVDLDYANVYLPVTIYYTITGSPASGVAVISFNNKALNLKAILEHPGATRALYIGDELYTVSANSVKVFNIKTLQPVAEIPLE